MYRFAYQGGASVEMINAVDKQPQWSVNRQKWKSYDKSVKGYTISLEGHTTQLSFPSNDKKTLGLIQSNLVLQIKLHQTQNFSLEVTVADSSSVKKRLLFTNSAKEISVSAGLVRIPSHIFLKDRWINLCLDVSSFVSKFFAQCTFKSIMGIVVHSYCKIRRVFTLKNPLIEGSLKNGVPRNLEFPFGVDFTNQFISASLFHEEKKIKPKSLNPSRTSFKGNRSTSVLYPPKPAPKPKKVEETVVIKNYKKDDVQEDSIEEEINESIHVCSSLEDTLVNELQYIEEDIEISDFFINHRDVNSSPHPQVSFYNTGFNQATQARPFTPPFLGLENQRDPEEEIELEYDSVLNCYFDPSTNEYYELKDV